MFGGDLKLSRLATLAAAGVLAGSVSAQAADLGGNCCADLEERVAELEATTARKGNRKVSLKVYGHVNEMLIWWDDGFESNVYQNTNDDSRTRFGFRGNAKINSDWSAGFKIEVGARSTTRSDRADQDDPGRVPSTDSLDLRKANWYLRSKTFGKITVGRESTADSGITTINLARVNAPRFDDFNDRFQIVGAPGGITWDDTTTPWSYNPPSRTRANGVRYDSPTFAGFKVSGTWGEDDYWSVAIRYAGELGAFRIAAGAAYNWHNDPSLEDGCTEVAGAADCEAWGVGGSIMHTPTGLFVSAGYGEVQDNNRLPAAISDKDSFWVVTAGIEGKWSSLGKTTLYGTYYDAENNRGESQLGGAGSFLGQEMWSIGINQQISAAAMDLYLAYYNVEADLVDSGGAAVPTEDFQAVITGAKIRF